jgi:membrane-bound serine protease (ClpP class)
MRLGPAFRRTTGPLLAGVIAWLGLVAGAEPPVAVVPVRLPLVGTRDTDVETAVVRQLDHLRSSPAERGLLVLRFTAVDGEEASGSDFGRALGLARFLADPRLARVKTLAWLPEGASGHAVLVALACDEIAIGADSVLGPAGREGRAVDATTRAGYAEVAARRRTVPAAVAVGMVDPAARVVRLSTDDGERFVEEAEVEPLRRQRAVLAAEPMEPVPLSFAGRRARELGFVQLLASSAEDLARGLGVPERALATGPSVTDGWKAARVTLSGGITPQSVERTKSRIERAIADGATFIWLWIDSPGGLPEQSLVLANWLAGLDPANVRTVAYVPEQARGDAALVALACDELVVRPGAVIGGGGAAAIGDRQGEAIAAAWRGGVARTRGRSWSLPLATVVPGLEVRRAEEQGTGRIEHFTETELAARDDRDRWELGPRIGVGPLELDGRRAAELGLAAHVVDDAAGLRQAYGLDGAIAMAEPGWADRLLEALASPSLAWLLLLIGGAGLFIELKTPGIGFGGFVAMVAFIVYFWSQHLNGTSGWLEVMLFLAGLVCVAAEIFVLPGFGVLGLGGGLLVIASIVLASQSFVLPVNAYQIGQMQRSLLGILGAVAGVTVLALAARRWLPSTPLLRDVLLEPPAEGGFAAGEADDIVGAEGTTTTRLAPAGKARIAGAVRDVVADADLIEPGVAVRVVEVRGGRVVVRAT